MIDITTIIPKIKVIKSIITNGFSKTLETVNIGADEIFLKSLEHYTQPELLDLLQDLKKQMSENTNRRKVEVPLKFCIGQCQSEFHAKDGMLEVYCPSCDRVKATRPIKS